MTKKSTCGILFFMLSPEETHRPTDFPRLRHGTSIHLSSEELREAQISIFEVAFQALEPICRPKPKQLPELFAELKAASTSWYIVVKSEDGTQKKQHLLEFVFPLNKVPEETAISYLKEWQALVQKGKHITEAGRRFDAKLLSFIRKNEVTSLTPGLRRFVLDYFKKADKGAIGTPGEIDAFFQHLEDFVQDQFDQSKEKWRKFNKKMREGFEADHIRDLRSDLLLQAYALMKSGAILVIDICKALGRPENDLIRERVSSLSVLADLAHKISQGSALFIEQLQKYEDTRLSNRQAHRKDSSQEERLFIRVILDNPRIKALREKYAPLDAGVELSDWLECQIKRVHRREPASGLLITAHETDFVRHVFDLLQEDSRLQEFRGRMILSDLSNDKKKRILQELSSGEVDYVISSELKKPPVEALNRRVVLISLSQHARPLSSYPWVEALRSTDNIERIVPYVKKGSFEALRRSRARRLRQGKADSSSQEAKTRQTEPGDTPEKAKPEKDSSHYKTRRPLHPIPRFFFACEQRLERYSKLLNEPEAYLKKEDVESMSQMSFLLRMKAEESLLDSKDANRQRFQKQLTTFFEGWLETALTNAVKQPEKDRQILIFSWNFTLLRTAAGLGRELQEIGIFARAFRDAISRFIKNIESEELLEFSDSLSAKQELIRQPKLRILLGHPPL